MLIFILIFFLFFNKQVKTQELLTFNAPYIPHTDTTLVFLPEDYDDDKNYSLVFMLHGWSGNYNQWNEISDLKKYANDFQFIIVCPDGFYDSWYIDSPLRLASQFEYFFFNDLVPEIFNRYSVDTTNIFITGLSMGGHGAIYLTINNPEFFKAAGSTSGILDITEFPGKWGMEKILGSIFVYPENWKKFSCYEQLYKLEWSYKPLYIDCGTEDFAYKSNKKFIELAHSLGIKADYKFDTGDHSQEYWRSSIKNHFKFFKGISEK